MITKLDQIDKTLNIDEGKKKLMDALMILSYYWNLS